MDVTCDRCNTRYEFDAALVSNRGTTVKCTNCGHQFKVFRPPDLASLDGWTIRTLDGRELTFRAMRELQAAIGNGDVSTEDVLLPGDNSEPRRPRRSDVRTEGTSPAASAPDNERKTPRGVWSGSVTRPIASRTVRPLPFLSPFQRIVELTSPSRHVL